MALRFKKFQSYENGMMDTFLKEQHIEKDAIYKIDIVVPRGAEYTVLIWYWKLV
jgi:hypothetical protein